MRKFSTVLSTVLATVKKLAAARGTVEELRTKAELWVNTHASKIVAIPLAFIRFYSGLAMVGVKIAEALNEFPQLKKDLDAAFTDLNAAATTPKKRGRKAKVVEATAPAAEVKIRMRKVRKDKGQKRRPVFTPTTIISTVNRTPRSTSPANPLCVAGDCLGCDKAETCSTKGALS